MADWTNPGYPIEFHEIVTEDHYILKLTRITDFVKESEVDEPLEESEKIRKKPAVLIVHGFLCSADDWIVNEPDKVLPYRLINEGYDVWLGNLRGTPLSRGHTKIPKQSKSRKYWDFTWHEIGLYDIPAMIDHILKTTGQESLYYIGHSMGCAVLAVGVSLRPEYCSKIKIMTALAPAVHGSHITNKYFRPLIPLGNLLAKSKFLRTREIMGKTSAAYGKLCFPYKKSYQKLGAALIKTFGVRLGAFGTDQIEKERMKHISTQWPSPTSMKLFCHGIQCFKSGMTRQFDYGPRANIKIYGQASPPEYDFDKIKFPIAVFYSDCDKLCTPKDVIQLTKELPNVIGIYQISEPGFNHVDFMYGKDVNHLVYDKVITIIRDASSDPVL